MRNHLIVMVLMAALLLSAPHSCYSQEFRTAYVDFMYVPEGMAADYLQMEREMAMPAHEEAIRQGKLESWSLWAIPLPGGTNAEYHYATVRIYSSSEQMQHAGDFIEIFQQVHEGKDFDEMSGIILDSRDLVKTHRLSSWMSFSDDQLTSPPSVIQVVYLKVPLNKGANYTAMEEQLFHPLHKKEIELGLRAGWEGWQLQQPFGSSVDYTHVAVDSYKDADQLARNQANNYGEMVSEVHPGKSWSQVMDTFMETAELVRVEEWRLLESVAAGPPN